MKKIPAALSAVLLLGSMLVLSGCSNNPYLGDFDDAPYSDQAEPEDEYTEPPAGGNTEDLAIYAVELPEGKVVDCVSSTYGDSEAKPECDWSSVRVGKPSKDSGLKSYTVTNRNRSVICVASDLGGADLPVSCDWAQAKKL